MLINEIYVKVDNFLTVYSRCIICVLFKFTYLSFNAKVDSFLTACLVLTFALVVGLGLGHFLGEIATFSQFPPRIKLISEPDFTCSSQSVRMGKVNVVL